MQKKYFIGTLLWSVIFLYSCNDNSIFEGELYKKVFALVSNGEYNVFEEKFILNGGESIGYVSAVAGGTSSLEEDLEVSLIESRTAFDIYNRAIYDADESKYAKLLPKSHYEIEDYRILIPAGKRQGKMMVKVKPEGLSPDSIYFISLMVDDFSTAQVNDKKRNVLYRILLENKYASQAVSTLYRMNGIYNGVATAGNKVAHPLSWNKIRIMAGTEPFQADLTLIERSAITLEIAHDNKVRIHPYGNINVRSLNTDPDYPNIFRVEEIDGRIYNVFLLHYQYVIAGTTHTMKEELRFEVKK